MEPGFEALYQAQVERKVIKENCAVGLGGERNQFTSRFADRLVKNPANVGRLTAQAGAAINDLAVYFPCRKTDEAHAVPFFKSPPVLLKIIPRPSFPRRRKSTGISFQLTGTSAKNV
jgi:hypothetical protein